MALNHNLDEFRRELQRAQQRIPNEVLRPLVRFAEQRFTQFATEKYMQDAGFEAGKAGSRRDPDDSGPLRVVSTRLSRAVEGSFYQGRREGRTELSFTSDGVRWRRVISVPYAALHEFGGTVRQQVTADQEAFFWYKYMNAADEGEKAKWKAMALSSTLTVNIKARPYAGTAMEDTAPEVEDRAGELLYELMMDITP